MVSPIRKHNYDSYIILETSLDGRVDTAVASIRETTGILFQLIVNKLMLNLSLVNFRTDMFSCDSFLHEFTFRQTYSHFVADK